MLGLATVVPAALPAILLRRNECLDHAVVVNEAHLRSVLAEFAADYVAERPHRSLALEPPLAPRQGRPTGGERIRARPVLGGLHHAYERAA
jgi:hypothetical protein